MFNLNMEKILLTYMNNISRSGAVAARWAHNPKVGGSNPPSRNKSKD